MGKKGAIGLSINMLVVIIISLAIFGGGIALLYNLISETEETKAMLDAQTKAELERFLVDQGKKVALSRHTAAISSGDLHSFGLGVLNIEESVFGTQFNLEVDLSKAFDETETEFSTDISQWLYYDPEPFIIEENQHKSLPIGIGVPKDTKKGTYIFNVKIHYNHPETSEKTQYDTTKKITIIVK